MTDATYTVPQDMHAVRPLLIDAQIPPTHLIDGAGNPVDVNALVTQKPTVLLFFRGGWCGFCKKQLVEIRQNYDKIEAEGFQVIAISPDSAANSAETQDKFNLPFPVLGDPTAQALKDYGIAWEVAGKDDAYYAKLENAAGEAHHILPAPAYFIVNTQGKIHFQYVNPNYRVRLPFELMLAAVKAVKQMIAAAEDA